MTIMGFHIIEPCVGRHWDKVAHYKPGRKCRECGKVLSVYNKAHHCFSCRMEHRQNDTGRFKTENKWR